MVPRISNSKSGFFDENQYWSLHSQKNKQVNKPLQNSWEKLVKPCDEYDKKVKKKKKEN